MTYLQTSCARATVTVLVAGLAFAAAATRSAAAEPQPTPKWTGGPPVQIQASDAVRSCNSPSAPPRRCMNVLARRLARRLTSGTHAARERAAYDLMAAIGVRVRTSKDKPLIPGGRGLPRAFTLFAPEVVALSAAFNRGELSTMAHLADVIEGVRLVPKGTEVSPEVLARAISAAARSAGRRPDTPRSLGPLVLREIGLQRANRPYDLRRVPVADTPVVDPLQAFVLMADLVVSATREASGPGNKHRSRPTAVASQANRRPVTLGDIWRVFKRNVLRRGYRPRKVPPIQAAIHAQILAYSVRVSSTSPDVQESHYGPAGHVADAGRPLTFRTRVEMLEDWTVLERLGVFPRGSVPKKGPIPGVRVVWFDDRDRLADHGAVAYDPASGETDATGTARLTFTPKDETAVVPVGLTREARGHMTGLALYQSAFGNIFGSIGQWVTPKYAGFAWSLIYHDQSLALDVDMDVTHNTAIEPTTLRARVTGLPFNRQPSGIGGEKAQELLSYHKADWGCWTHSWAASWTAPFRITSLAVNWSDASTPAVSMTFDPGALSEVITHTCEGDSYDEQQTVYRDALAALVGGTSVTGWEYAPSPDIFARKQYSATGGEFSGQVTFILRRSPADP